MAEAATGRSTVPWSQRLFEAAPVAPLWLGVAIAAGLSAVFLAAELAQDRFAELAASPAATDPHRDFRLAFVNFLLLAWGPTALAYAARGARQTRRALRPLAAPGAEAEWAAIEAEAGAYPRGAVLAAGLFGALAGLVSPLFTSTAALVPPYDPSLWNPEVVWHRWTAPLIGWFGGRFLHAALAEAARLSALAHRLGPIDVLDPRPLAPFTRQGLRHALLATVYVSIYSAFLFELGLGEIFFAIGGVTVLVAGASLFLAVRGAHLRLREAKRLELEACRAALAEARRGAGPLPADGARLARVADLVTLERRIEAVREWPFDPSTLARVALYVLLPLGSWLGGALVERLVGAILG